jgi:ATP-dependent DNA helicase PIF1
MITSHKRRFDNIAHMCCREGETENDSLLCKLISNIMSNQFVLVSGKAGTGKSFLLQHLRTYLEDANMRVVVSAPTGVAAVNISGTTLHSWLGLGLANETVDELKKKMSQRTRSSLSYTHVLLIDEISMVDPDFFEIISKLCQIVHHVNRPFGKMKIVMFGDFLQLPPITKSINRFVFNTDLWQQMKVHRMYLTQVHRQKDSDFLEILNEVRNGSISIDTERRLLERCIQPTEPYTRLCTYRNQVLSYNSKKLNDIDATVCSKMGYYKITNRKANVMISDSDLKSSKRLMATSEKNFPVLKELLLKRGAQVMMRCNVYLNEGICNGSIGNVIDIHDDNVVVCFQSLILPIKMHSFILQVGQTANLTLVQYPLSLSWAMTIHKAQGLTIDRVLVDTNCFETGQMYTAFSRVKSLSGLFITSLNKGGLKVDQRALSFEHM